MAGKNEMSARRKTARKTALNAFLALGKQEGDILTHDEIEAMMGLPPLNFAGMSPEAIVAAVSKRQFRRLAFVEELRDVLLTCEAEIEIKSVVSQGYRLTPHAERVDSAVDDHTEQLKRAMAKFNKRAKHIPAVKQLPYDQQRKLDHAKFVAMTVRAAVNMRPPGA